MIMNRNTLQVAEISMEAAPLPESGRDFYPSCVCPPAYRDVLMSYLLTFLQDDKENYLITERPETMLGHILSHCVKDKMLMHYFLVLASSDSFQCYWMETPEHVCIQTAKPGPTL